jgi:hypothetical protein
MTGSCVRIHWHGVVIYGRPYGRAIAQAVSRWLPNAAARVQTRVVWSCGIL